jgi:hypothetical protein
VFQVSFKNIDHVSSIYNTPMRVPESTSGRTPTAHSAGRRGHTMSSGGCGPAPSASRPRSGSAALTGDDARSVDQVEELISAIRDVQAVWTDPRAATYGAEVTVS